jgi:hypothetical protein
VAAEGHAHRGKEAQRGQVDWGKGLEQCSTGAAGTQGLYRGWILNHSAS